jgi:hypothetical protein
MGPAYRQAPYLMLSRVGLVDFPGTSPFVNIPADMLSVPLEDILAAVPRYTSLLASAQDGARLARMPAATQLPTTSQHKQEAEEDGG